LLDYHRNWYVEDGPQKHTKEIYQGAGGQWFLTTQEKKRILLNNVYGVDIDNQAVEVTKLSLLLKVLEGENQDSLTRQLKMWRERALPDLGNNIKCGNSLIGPDFYQNKQIGLLEDETLPDHASIGTSSSGIRKRWFRCGDWQWAFMRIQTRRNGHH
jgi:hypothetical protein